MVFEVDHQSNMKQCYPILLWGGFWTAPIWVMNGWIRSPANHAITSRPFLAPGPVEAAFISAMSCCKGLPDRVLGGISEDGEMHNENMTGHLPKNDPKGWEVSATSNLNISKSKHHGSHGCEKPWGCTLQSRILWLDWNILRRHWLVVEPYPSEKWWSSSIGMTTFPIWWESHKIPWFQSPPTSDY